MQTKTVRSALRGITATLAICAALAGGAAAASAAPLPLEPMAETTSTTTTTATPVGEEFTSGGSSTISSSVNATVACLLQRTLSAQGKWDC